jgi:hypothetical protein
LQNLQSLDDPLLPHGHKNLIVKELEQISRILDANPRLMDLVFQALVATHRANTDREGMPAEH